MANFLAWGIREKETASSFISRPPSTHTESINRVFPRFRDLPGEMFRHVAKAHTVAEHLSRPFSQPGQNSFDGLCIGETVAS